jgi:hypothetical protein
MAAPGRERVGLARHDWTEVLDLPGASQMRHLRALLESRDFLSRVPDQSLLLNNPPTGPDHARATRGDGYIFVYLPTGKPVDVRLRAYRRGGGVRGWFVSWFNPRTGEWLKAPDAAAKEVVSFTPPGSPGRGNDWVLVLDALS